MRTTRIVLAVCLALILAAAGYGEGTKEAPGSGKAGGVQYITIGTASVGGAFYPIGMAFAKIWNDTIPNVNSLAQATAGSPQNILMLESKEIQAAVIRGEECDRAYKGIEIYAGKPKQFLRALTPLYVSAMQIFALKDRGINSVADFRGKRVAIGPIGSGGEADARDILKLYNLSYQEGKKDLIPEYIEAGQAVEMMKDGLIDAAFLGLTVGSSAIVELMLSGKVKMIPFEEDILVKHIKDAKANFFKHTIEPNTYPNQNYPVLTRGTPPMLMCVHQDMPEDLVYQMTKSLATNVKAVQESHSIMKSWTPKEAMTVPPIPYHPGAVKYWKEAGIIK